MIEPDTITEKAIDSLSRRIAQLEAIWPKLPDDEKGSQKDLVAIEIASLRFQLLAASSQLKRKLMESLLLAG